MLVLIGERNKSEVNGERSTKGTYGALLLLDNVRNKERGVRFIHSLMKKQAYISESRKILYVTGDAQGCQQLALRGETLR